MAKTLTKINPLSSAKVLGVIYGLFTLIFVPFFLLAAIFSPQKNHQAGVGGIAILFLLYPIFGFIGGLIGSCIYNLAAHWVGGVEIEVEDK